jgi:hypothetical protein
MMDEETLFNCTDELVMEALEDHREYARKLERQKYDEADLLCELQLVIDSDYIDWSRVFILAVMGVKLNDIE